MRQFLISARNEMFASDRESLDHPRCNPCTRTGIYEARPTDRGFPYSCSLQVRPRAFRPPQMMYPRHTSSLGRNFVYIACLSSDLVARRTLGRLRRHRRPGGSRSLRSSWGRNRSINSAHFRRVDNRLQLFAAKRTFFWKKTFRREYGLSTMRAGGRPDARSGVRLSWSKAHGTSFLLIGIREISMHLGSPEYPSRLQSDVLVYSRCLGNRIEK